MHIAEDDNGNGMALVQQLRRNHPRQAVFVVTDRKDPDLILQGLRLGIMDVIIPTANGAGAFSAGRCSTPLAARPPTVAMASSTRSSASRAARGSPH